jgi:hypothetical protein
LRVLLDENLPRRLKRHLPSDVEAVTVQERGWSGKKNGALLRDVAGGNSTRTMKGHLKRLLDQLDSTMESHEEVGDTDVREQMYAAVYHGFIVQTPDYTLPSEFGMFEPAGNSAVRSALTEFISAASALGIPTPQQRFEAFQDNSVLSSAGNAYDEYFGDAGSLDELPTLMVQRPKPAETPSAKPWWRFWE